MERGGVLTWPLLACSLLSVTVIVERVLFWIREGKRANGKVTARIVSAVAEGREEEVLALDPEKLPAPARALRKALENREMGLIPAFEVAAQEEIEKMKRGLSVLDTIVTLGPLLGILGTVLGIIESFHLLGAMGIENPRAVTGGIAQALITTAFGLSVAIVSLIPFNIFVSKVERAASEMEKVGARLQAALSSKEERDEVPHGI